MIVNIILHFKCHEGFLPLQSMFPPKPSENPHLSGRMLYYIDFYIDQKVQMRSDFSLNNLLSGEQRFLVLSGLQYVQDLSGGLLCPLIL